jgi:hypothetical protein
MINKRGQFYLIAAVVIILIILGLVTVINKAIVQPKPVGFFDLSEDYEAEASKVIDYGTYNKYSPAVNISEKIQNITAVFAKSAFAKDPTVHLVFIYGNKNGYIAENISTITSSISYGAGGNPFTTDINTQKVEFTKGFGDVNVSLAGNKYEFKLGDEENFYFIIQTTTPTGERNVAVRD